MRHGLVSLMMASASGVVGFIGGDIQTYDPTTSDITVDLTSLTDGLASSPSTGDLVIVVFGVEANGNADFSSAIADGWTTRIEHYVNSTYDTNVVIAYKVMGALVDTALTIYGGTSAFGRPGIAMVQVWRGVDVNSIIAPMNVSSSTGSILANPPAPYASPSNPDSFQLVFAVGADNESVVETYSSSFFDGLFASDGKGHEGGFGGDQSVVGAHGWKTWVNGDDNPPAFTYSGASSAANSYLAYTIILEPEV